ncbi:MAG TPA: hypothetical protein DDX20_06490, partial [Stenotrophomonas sp.]|nr:hypothetical protein [Stenotrophomonas sp.]
MAGRCRTHRRRGRGGGRHGPAGGLVRPPAAPALPRGRRRAPLRPECRRRTGLERRRGHPERVTPRHGSA